MVKHLEWKDVVLKDDSSSSWFCPNFSISTVTSNSIYIRKTVAVVWSSSFSVPQVQITKYHLEIWRQLAWSSRCAAADLLTALLQLGCQPHCFCLQQCTYIASAAPLLHMMAAWAFWKTGLLAIKLHISRNSTSSAEAPFIFLKT